MKAHKKLVRATKTRRRPRVCENAMMPTKEELQAISERVAQAIAERVARAYLGFDENTNNQKRGEDVRE